MLNRTNTVLVILLVAIIAASLSFRVDPSKPNIEVMPDMKYSPAWSAFAVNPNFPNGRTMQQPVRGTIARGELPMPYDATKEDAIRAGEELRNPYHLNVDDPVQPGDFSASRRTSGDSSEIVAYTDFDSSQSTQPLPADDEQTSGEDARQRKLQESIQRGGEVYRVFCITCHGVAGAGDGPVTQRGFPPPPSLLVGKSREMKDGQLFHILTYGQNNMASMAPQLSRERRWDVINFVRKMQADAPAVEPAATDETAPSLPTDGDGEPLVPDSDAESSDDAPTQSEET